MEFDATNSARAKKRNGEESLGDATLPDDLSERRLDFVGPEPTFRKLLVKNPHWNGGKIPLN